MAIAQGRCLVGVNTSDNDFKTPEKTGGEKTHKLTIAEMPSHSHNHKLAYGSNDPAKGFNYGNTYAGTFDDNTWIVSTGRRSTSQ